jgi:GNAT superfamily N-acetyltransferase
MDEQRDWDDLLAPAEVKLCDVACDEAGTPVGVIMAEVRPDRHLRVPAVIIQWIAVAPEARGRGLSAPLLQRALSWGAEHGATSAEVFVTAANAAAVRAYERAGFAPVDVRMMRPLG